MLFLGQGVLGVLVAVAWTQHSGAVSKRMGAGRGSHVSRNVGKEICIVDEPADLVSRIDQSAALWELI